jgi:hypothetical protein
MADAIFVHAWWRSGSTYIWSKLRENNSCRCYYEPLHERIALLTADAVEAPPEVDVSQALRHPIPQKHYFAEYAELLRSGRLHYSPDLAYDRYFLRPGQPDDGLHLYLDQLISAAAGAGRRPVLCFCRSQMRSAWMKESFGGIHIAQIRNPFDQWTSFNVEPYFTNKMLLIALRLRHSYPHAFAHIEPFERFAQHLAKRPSLSAELFSKFFVSAEDALAVFLTLWVVSALQAISFCDFVLDIDRLSTDVNYRHVVSQWFESIGCPIDFSDCSIPVSSGPQVRDPSFQGMVEVAASAIRTGTSSLVLTDTNVVKRRLSSFSPQSRRVLSLALGGE